MLGTPGSLTSAMRSLKVGSGNYWKQNDRLTGEKKKSFSSSPSICLPSCEKKKYPGCEENLHKDSSSDSNVGFPSESQI